jgi:hypothetical protein
MVLLKNLISNVSDKNIKHSQNGSKCKIEPFFIFIRYKIKFKKNKMRLNRFKIEFKHICIL